MRIANWKHFPWFLFVCLATVAACILYLANFHSQLLPAWIHVPPSLIQTPTEHHTVGGTPLGLAFGAISLGIFIFAALLNLRKKVPLWRIGTVQRWLRAHIWLTFLTIPLVILHSGFRFGGPMTTLLMVLYAIVMVSGIYGLVLQNFVPRLMKDRLPAETVFEQIPHIRSQLCVAAEKMRDSFRPPPKKAVAAASAPAAAKGAATASGVMASTKGELSTPTARPKSATGSALTAASVTGPAAPASAAAPIGSVANAVASAERKPAETVSASRTETSGDGGADPVSRSTAPPPNNTSSEVLADRPQVPAPGTHDIPKGDPSSPTPQPKAEGPAPAAAQEEKPPAAKPSAPASTAKVVSPTAAVSPPAKPAAPKPTKPTVVSDPRSEALLADFIDQQILPYLRARRGDRFRLGKARFSEDTFRYIKLGVSEAYRNRVEEIQGWCDERRLLDLQTRLHHWLHGWLFIHVPFSFLLLMLTIWHACVTLFYY